MIKPILLLIFMGIIVMGPTAPNYPETPKGPNGPKEKY